MIRRIEPGGMEACSLDGDSAACSLEAAGSLDAAGNGSFGVLAAFHGIQGPEVGRDLAHD